MLRLLGEVERVAAERVPVLLLGETGTGKELLARTLHASSARSSGPFVAVNCGALPAELIEAELFGVARGAATGVTARDGALRRADGGTFFLDEVGELPPALQAKLLRVLESGEVTPLGGTPTTLDLRFIAATNRDLRAEVEGGRFRSDLYFRLAAFSLLLPPLRDRREDLPVLLEELVERASRDAGREPAGLSLGLLEQVSAYSWPGNLRQLAHEVRRWVTFAPEGEIFDSSLLSEEVRSDPAAARSFAPGAGRPESLDLDQRMAATERELVARALVVAGGNQSRAAKLLGISRNGLAAKIARHGLAAGDAESPASEADDDRT
jgi:two-component system response regulator AtoC